MSREVILAAAKAAREQLGDTVSRSDFVRASGIKAYHIYRLFPGGWKEVQELAGICRRADAGLTDDQLLAEFHRVATMLGKIPTWFSFGAHAVVSAATVRKRFGGQQGTLCRYRQWLEANAPNSEFLAALKTKTEVAIVRLPPAPIEQPSAETPQATWSKGEGIEFGAPIDFRGLRHAPINEQGVVYLFGTISDELGFIVEAVQQGFPDCEAKRCVNARENRWQRVRIEFEFRSRQFFEHCHDPRQCDLIICWEHDWPDCPLEVIELRRLIEGLRG